MKNHERYKNKKPEFDWYTEFEANKRPYYQVIYLTPDGVEHIWSSVCYRPMAENIADRLRVDPWAKNINAAPVFIREVYFSLELTVK